MGSLEKFCLRWSEFGANVTHSFGDLRKKGQLFDVTISTDDDNDSNTANLLAHKGPFTYDDPHLVTVALTQPICTPYFVPLG